MSDASQRPPNDRNWPKDAFGKKEVFSSLSFLWIALIAILAALLLPWLAGVKNRNQVVAYCAQDQDYAEPVFRDFERETGIRVRAVYDSEAVKTVGLANRLLAERSHPQCDVFWGNQALVGLEARCLVFSPPHPG